MPHGQPGGKLEAAVIALYWERPTAADLINTPYTLDDYPEPECEVWDENWDVVLLFQQNSTQWRTGMGGPIGLDYNVFHHALDRKRVSGADFDEAMQKLRVIESEALRQLHKSSPA